MEGFPAAGFPPWRGAAFAFISIDTLNSTHAITLYVLRFTFYVSRITLSLSPALDRTLNQRIMAGNAASE
jgi:hypothetical protein